MKISISTDMEGISGIVDRAQISPPGIDYDRGRKLMTEDINASVRGALAAGATEVIVSGGHGGNGARNVLVEQLHPEAILISGSTRKYRLQSIDSTYDAVIQIGYHARNGFGGVLDHSITARDVAEIRIDGKPIGEIGMNGLAAGWHGVPVVLVSGCDRVVRETAEWFPWAEGVAVKRAIGRHAALCLHPRRAQALIEEASTRALSNLQSMKPLRPDPPYRGEVQFKLTTHAEAAEDAPLVERVDDVTVAYRTDDIPDLLRTIRMIIRLGGTNQPSMVRGG